MVRDRADRRGAAGQEQALPFETDHSGDVVGAGWTVVRHKRDFGRCLGALGASTARSVN